MTSGVQIARIGTAVLRDGIVPLLVARRAIRGFGAVQRTWELQSLLGLVRRRQPRVVVEIGTYLGGTLSCWPAVSSPDASFVSIDLPQHIEGLAELDSRGANISRIRQSLKRGQRLVEIIGDSHLAETLDRLTICLAGMPIDILWIDGDHSYEGVAADMKMYGPLVRSGGLVAFHDIHRSALYPSSQSHVYWQEIKELHRTAEFIGDPTDGSGMGVGVLFA